MTACRRPWTRRRRAARRRRSCRRCPGRSAGRSAAARVPTAGAGVGPGTPTERRRRRPRDGRATRAGNVRLPAHEGQPEAPFARHPLRHWCALATQLLQQPGRYLDIVSCTLSLSQCHFTCALQVYKKQVQRPPFIAEQGQLLPAAVR